jgi:hypothetical protein
MEQSEEAIEADLISGDLSRLQSALHLLLDRMNSGQETVIAPLSLRIFEGLGDHLPEEIQLDFLSLLDRYKWFNPPLSLEKRISTMIALVLRYGGSFAAYDAALNVAISADPARSVEVAMDAIPIQGLSSPESIEAAKHFVSRLLDRKEEARRTTVRKLREWPKDAPYQAVIDYIKPELDPEELLDAGLG